MSVLSKVQEFSQLQSLNEITNLTRDLKRLEVRAAKKKVQEEKRKEADKLKANHGKSYHEKKFWWNDQRIKHVTTYEKNIQKNKSKSRTLNRKNQIKDKFDNCQCNSEEKPMFSFKKMNSMVDLYLDTFKNNSQIGLDLNVLNLEGLTEALTSFKIPESVRLDVPNLLPLSGALKEIKSMFGDLKSMVSKPIEIQHKLSGILDPLVNCFSVVRDIGWKGILVDFILFVIMCYCADWKRSVVISGLMSFIWVQRHFFNDVALIYELISLTNQCFPEDNAHGGEEAPIIGGVIASLCVVLASIGLGKLPGGKTTSDLFMRLSRVGACMSSIKLMHEFFSESVTDILDYFRVNWFGYLPTKLNEWERYDEFCNEVEKLHNTDLERDIPSNLTLKNHIDSLIMRGDSLLKEIEKLRIPHLQTARFRSHYMFLDKVRAMAALGGGGMQAPRVPAQIVQFYGETGVGKSELTSMLNASLLASQGFTTIEDFHRLIYYRDSSQVRFDGFISQVQGVVIDDYGSRHDSVSNPNNEPLEIIRMSNGAVWKLDMPNLSEKGNTFFSAKWVILTSNQSHHQWDSLTNPEAVARRIALKYRQYPHPDFSKDSVINNKKVVTLDVEKVELEVIDDPTAYSRVWLFDKIDGQNKSANPTILREKMTFDEVVDECVQLVNQAQDRGSRRLQNTNNMFLKYVEKYKNITKRPDNIQMMEERTEERVEQPIVNEAVRPKFKELLKPKEDITIISASSKAEMMAKTSAWADYAFGSGGGDPYRNNRGFRHVESVHDHPGMVSLNEILPRDENFKTSFIEKITGKTHIDLAALLAQNPDYVCKSFVGNYNSLTISDNPTNYANLLMHTCMIIPEEHIEKFTVAYSTAMNVLMVYSGAKPIEQCYLFKRLPENSLHLFNQVLHYFLNGKSLSELGIEHCSEHFNGCKLMDSVYSFMTISHSFVSRYYAKVSLWASWIKTELIFTTVRAVTVIAISLGMTSLWKWLTGTSSKKNNKKNIVESCQERNKKTLNAESHQDRNRGAPSNNIESFQAKNKGNVVNNVESFQNKEKGAKSSNVECAISNAEAVSDQNALEVLNAVNNNLYSIMNADTKTPLGYVFFLVGRMAITNRHIALNLRKNIIISNSEHTFEMTSTSIALTAADKESLHYDKDIVLLEFPRHIRIHSDISHHFMTKVDFSLHKSLRKVALVGHRRFSSTRYGNLCRARDMPFELIASGITTIVREAYEYNIETVKGDCGSAVIAFDKNFERKIIGIHMAAGTGEYLGVAVAVHRDFLEELYAMHKRMYPESMLNGQCNIPVEEVEDRPFPGEYLFLGKVENIYRPNKTNINPSPLHGVIAEPITKPARLKRFERDGEIIDPFVNARKKALTPSVPIDEEILDRSVRHYSNLLLQNIDPFDQRVLTMEQAIVGIENEPTYLPIKRNTSPGGLPTYHGWLKTGKGKRAYLDDGQGGYRVDHPLVVQKVSEMLTKLKSGSRSDTVWIDTLKDERRTIDKVNAGKTRLFAAGEMAYLILFRQYFFGFASHMMKNRIGNESCVGINVYSSEWSILATRMRSKGRHIVAGDFTNYDGTLSATFLWALLDIIEEFYQGTDEEVCVRRMMWLDIVNSVHVSENCLYMWSHSQPSGCPITALLNSLYHSVSARYVYVVCAKKYAPDMVSLLNFDNHVAHNNYGDDDLWNISNDIISWFNQETISEAYATIGMTYTDELKTGSIVPSRTLEDVQFLKRKFRYDYTQARYRCPLSLDTILEMAMWMHGTKNVSEVVGDTLQEAVYELSHHSEDVFNEHFPKFRKAQQIISVPLGTYNEYQETEYYRYCV